MVNSTYVGHWSSYVGIPMSNVGIPTWVFQVQPRNSEAREPTNVKIEIELPLILKRVDDCSFLKNLVNKRCIDHHSAVI